MTEKRQIIIIVGLVVAIAAIGIIYWFLNPQAEEDLFTEKGGRLVAGNICQISISGGDETPAKMWYINNDASPCSRFRQCRYENAECTEPIKNFACKTERTIDGNRVCRTTTDWCERRIDMVTCRRLKPIPSPTGIPVGTLGIPTSSGPGQGGELPPESPPFPSSPGTDSPEQPCGPECIDCYDQNSCLASTNPYCEWYNNACNLPSCGYLSTLPGGNGYEWGCFPNGAPPGEGWQFAGPTNDCGYTLGQTAKGCFKRLKSSGPSPSPSASATATPTSNPSSSASPTASPSIPPECEYMEVVSGPTIWNSNPQGPYWMDSKPKPLCCPSQVSNHDSVDCFGNVDDQYVTCVYLLRRTPLTNRVYKWTYAGCFDYRLYPYFICCLTYHTCGGNGFDNEDPCSVYWK